MFDPRTPSQPRKRRNAKRERRAARRVELRAWKAKSASPIEARWFLASSEPSPFDELLAVGGSDADSAYRSPAMERLFNALRPVIEKHPGVFVVVGEAGVGKSVFAAHLGVDLGAAGYRVVASSHAEMEIISERLFATLCARLEREKPQSQEGRSVPILVADAADLLTQQAMRELPELFNATPSDLVDLRVILIGRPALEKHLEHPALAEVQPSIRFRGRLQPFDERDTRLFLRHLAPPESRAHPLSRAAIAALAHYSEGRPGDVKALWAEALRIAHAEDKKIPLATHVEKAVQRLLRPGADPKPTRLAADTDAAQSAAGHDRRQNRARRPGRLPSRAVAVCSATAAAVFVLFSAALFELRPDQMRGGSIVAQAENIRSTSDAPISTAETTKAIPAQTGIEVASNSSPDTSADPIARLSPSAPPTLPEVASVPSAAPMPAQADHNIAPPPERPAPTAGARTEPPRQPTPRHSVEPASARSQVAHLENPAARHGAQLAVATLTPPSPQAPPKTTTPPPAEADAAHVVAAVAYADPQCQPYVSSVNFAGSNTNVRGVACHDSSGRWWLMDQRTE